MEQNTTQSQIFNFDTLKEFTDYLEKTIDAHKSELARYEEELGQMLRQTPDNNANADWAKELQNKLNPPAKQPTQITQPSDKKGEKKKESNKESKKESKKESRKGNTNWKVYNDFHIFTGDVYQGKTEVYFEAINELKSALAKLDKVKEAVAELVSIGMSNLLYLVYTKNSLPTKLVLLPQTGGKTSKFEFKADFVTETMEVPVENREV